MSNSTWGLSPFQRREKSGERLKTFMSFSDPGRPVTVVGPIEPANFSIGSNVVGDSNIWQQRNFSSVVARESISIVLADINIVMPFLDACCFTIRVVVRRGIITRAVSGNDRWFICRSIGKQNWLVQNGVTRIISLLKSFLIFFSTCGIHYHGGYMYVFS